MLRPDGVEDPEYTGPPIGDPPVHVHNNEPVTDAIDDTQDAVDDLVAELRQLDMVSGTRHTELLERINTCQTQLETLSNRATDSPTESPILTQMLAQLTQIQSELQALKSETQSLKQSMATTLVIPARSESVAEVVQTESVSQRQENQIDVEEVTGGVENPTPPKLPNRRWV